MRSAFAVAGSTSSDRLAEIGVWHFILLGALSIAVVLIEPRGIWGLLRRYLPRDVISISHAPPE